MKMRIEFSLGDNCFGQHVQLVHEKSVTGRFEWTLHARQSKSVLDDTASIRGLTDDQLRAMAEAVKAVRS